MNSGTSDYSDGTTVSAVLTDANTNAPIADESVTLTLNGTETCTATTDATGTASCPITPGEAAATYTLAGSFGGDTTLPLQLTPSSGYGALRRHARGDRADLHRRHRRPRTASR